MDKKITYFALISRNGERRTTSVKS